MPCVKSTYLNPNRDLFFSKPTKVDLMPKRNRTATIGHMTKTTTVT